MKSFVALCLFFFAVSVASFPELQSSFYMPFVAWSNSGYFSTPNNYINEAVDMSFIPSTLNSLLTSTDPQDTPEVVVVYLASTLRSDLFRQYSLEGRVNNLQTFVSESRSSLVAPFVLSAETKTPVAQLLTSAAGNGKSLFVSTSYYQAPWSDIAKILTVDELKETLNKETKMFNNKQTEFVFVYFDDSQEIETVDTLMSEIDELVASKTSQFVSMFTGNLPTPSQVQTVFFEPHPLSLHRLVAGDGSPNSTYPNRWPAGVVQGVINGALLIFVVVFGIVVTSCIQTPDRFEGGQNPQRQH